MINPLFLSQSERNLDSLSQYTKAIRKFKILSADEERVLASQYKLNGDLKSASILISAHLRLVASIAYQFRGYGLPQSDLIQEGNIGLMKALKNFDIDKGVRLVTYAMIMIKSEMHEFIVRNCRIVKIATTHSQRKLFFNLRKLSTGPYSLSTTQINEISISLDVKPEEVRMMEARLDNNEISIDSHVGEEDEFFSPLMNLQDGSLTPEEALELKQFETNKTIKLNYALDQLDERSRRIITTRWLNELEAKTLSELSVEFGISAERVRQLEGKALKIMKQSLESTAF